MQTLGKVDHNEKIILLKSNGKRDPQAPRDSSLGQLQDHNKRDISRKEKKEKKSVIISPNENLCHIVNHTRKRKELGERSLQKGVLH